MRHSGVVVVIADPFILCLATLESAILAFDVPKMKRSTTFGLFVHVEDEDDEKYVFQLKLNNSTCCWTAGSNVSLCLVRASALEYEVHLCLELVEG